MDLEFARHIWTDPFHTVSLPGGAVGVATIQGSKSLLVTTGSSLLRVTPDGSTQTLYNTQDGYLKGVVSDGLHIYVTDEQNGRLFRLNNNGTGYTLLKEYSYIRTRWGRPDKAKVVSIDTGWVTAAINKLPGAQLAAEEAARQATLLANRQAEVLARQSGCRSTGSPIVSGRSGTTGRENNRRSLCQYFISCKQERLYKSHLF